MASAGPVDDVLDLAAEGPDPPGGGCRPYCTADEIPSPEDLLALLGPDPPGSGCRPYC